MPPISQQWQHCPVLDPLVPTMMIRQSFRWQAAPLANRETVRDHPAAEIEI